MSYRRSIKSLNQLTGKWRRGVERKRELEPYGSRPALKAQTAEYRPPTRETGTA